MNHICRIAVQEFALFTVAAFLEVVEVDIEINETYYPGVSAERTEGRGILFEIPV